jgi:hypothetical protein
MPDWEREQGTASDRSPGYQPAQGSGMAADG